MLNMNAFLVGLLFGLGLIISGMTDPSKVIGFLDLAGAWDPSLAFVMGGAILIGAGAFTIAKKRRHSFLGAPMRLSSATKLDKSLLIGSLVFGIGWGLSGFCPGPAVVSAAAGQPKAWIFVAAMLAGMALYGMIERRGKRYV
ncbi:MAG: YeeE/YedE family protein [Methylobacter sp.]|nr:YeeE/YedE family protein [Methylobacter sp.]